MDLVTLAMSMKNGGGGAGAPLIVQGELTEEDGAAMVVIETPPHKIYRAAEEGRPVYLEWTDDGETTITRLIRRRRSKIGSLYSYHLDFAGVTVSDNMGIMINVHFDSPLFIGRLLGAISTVIYNAGDITLYHNPGTATWSATPYDLETLVDTLGTRPINIRAYELGGQYKSQYNYTAIEIGYPEDAGYLVVTLNHGEYSFSLDVYPDGHVVLGD